VKYFVFDYFDGVFWQKMYPLKELQLIGKMKLPADVDRTKLEVQLITSM